MQNVNVCINLRQTSEQTVSELNLSKHGMSGAKKEGSLQLHLVCTNKEL